VSVRTVSKWRRRYRDEGEQGLLDRCSAPASVPSRTGETRVAVIAGLRRLRMTAAEIAQTLAMPVSTVSGILTWIGLGKLARLEPLEPPNRYEKQQPGELVHVDVKKLARIGRPGHRVNRDRRTRSRGIGWEYVHVAIDVDRPRFGGQRLVRRLGVVLLSFSRSRPGTASRVSSGA
jgi:hypothetical protein